MDPLRIALLQASAVGSDVAANLQKGDDWCRRAAAEGADLALFPELWSHGYRLPDPADVDAVSAWSNTALATDGPFVQHFASLAAELRLAIAITYLEHHPAGPRNTVTLFDQHGECCLSYAKVHTCEFGHEAVLGRGEGFPVASLATRLGPVQVGAMICYDREFPEPARILMLGGAELILVPNACELERNRLTQFRARAYENMLCCAMCNYPVPRCNGHSVVLDGLAFSPGGASLDMLLASAGEEEELVLAELDLMALREYRQRETWGNAFRRPGLYGALVDEHVAEVFRRPEARR